MKGGNVAVTNLGIGSILSNNVIFKLKHYGISASLYFRSMPYTKHKTSFCEDV